MLEEHLRRFRLSVVPSLMSPCQTFFPFISDESLCVELSRHGKSVCPIKHVLSGYRCPLLKHVFSHRRQVYMILNNRGEELEVRLHVKVDGFVHVLFVSSAAMKGKYK